MSFICFLQFGQKDLGQTIFISFEVLGESLKITDEIKLPIHKKIKENKSNSVEVKES